MSTPPKCQSLFLKILPKESDVSPCLIVTMSPLLEIYQPFVRGKISAKSPSQSLGTHLKGERYKSAMEPPSCTIITFFFPRWYMLAFFSSRVLTEQVSSLMSCILVNCRWSQPRKCSHSICNYCYQPDVLQPQSLLSAASSGNRKSPVLETCTSLIRISS